MDELNVILKENDNGEYVFVEVEDEDGNSVDGDWIGDYSLHHEAVRVEVGDD